MNRQVACAAGAMLLAGLGGWISPAFSQGPMAPRMDVAPPPVRVAPPPPPVFVPPPVAPTPPSMPVAPVMTPPPPPPAPKAPTASAPATPTPATPAPVATPSPAPPPATASQETPRGPAGGPPPYTDSQVKALRGVGVGLRGPGGQRQISSDSNGVVSLGKLGPGRHELSVNQKSLGTGTPASVQPVALIGILLPAVQAVREGERRYRTVAVRPVNDAPTLQIRIDVDARGQVSSVDPGDGIGFGVATVRPIAADVDGDGRDDIKLFEDLAKRNTSGETRLVFVAPVPGSNVAALAQANKINPGGPGQPKPNYANDPIPGVDVVVKKRPVGNAIKQTTGGDGVSTLGVLTPGTHSVTLDTKKLLDARVPGPSGSEPTQPAGILIGLLLPAVQKLGEAPRPTTVEHSFPRSVLANMRELQIDIVIPDGGGSPKVTWGDGSPQTDVGRDGIPAPSGLRVSADVSTIRVQNYLSSPQSGTGATGTPTALDATLNSSGSVIAAEAPVNTSRSNKKHGLPNVGVTATGPGGVMQARSDGGGWTRLGKLPVGNTIIEFSGTDLASALKTTGEPSPPTAQKTLVELLVVIAIVAIKTDGTQVVFTGSVPAGAVKTLKADLRIGRDGNAMTVDWGNGPQLPQPLPKTGPATLTVQGPNGAYTLEPVLVSSLQAKANNSAPGMVDANTAMVEIGTTR